MNDAPRLDIDYVARLARLALDDEERARFAKQLGDILAYVEQLSAVDIEGVEPTAHPGEVVNVWRADEPGRALDHESAMRNAPAVRDGMFVVPKVVDDA